jgi:DNA-binding NtrC family response regulator
VNQHSHGKPSILIVDDEQTVVATVQALLSQETGYDTWGFQDPQQALEFAARARIDAAVSGYWMPGGKNGIQFLSRIKELQPEASRVLMTGRADKNSAIEAIHRVSIFQYIEKPWDNQQFLLMIRSAVERARLFRALREKVDELDSAYSSLKAVQQQLVQAFL